MPDATAAKVVDASAVVALIFSEPEAERIVARLGSSRLLAPALLPFEVANACLMRARRTQVRVEEVLGAYDLLMGMRVELLSVEHAGVLGVAWTSKLTVYDASYLWLARKFGIELVTLDRQLAAAATRG